MPLYKELRKSLFVYPVDSHQYKEEHFHDKCSHINMAQTGVESIRHLKYPRNLNMATARDTGGGRFPAVFNLY